MAPYFNGVMKS